MSLSWSDVDRDGGVIRLQTEHSKNGRGRTVAIEGDLRAIIERRWQARKFKNADGQDRVAELVFHRAGRPVGDFRKAWAPACIDEHWSATVSSRPEELLRTLVQ